MTAVSEWKPWFAWWPVKIDGHRVWLRWVEMRHVTIHAYPWAYGVTQYR